MATRSTIQFKEVKNPNKPGRAPTGCVWVKEDGELLRNAEGHVAYRPLTEAEQRTGRSKMTVGRRKRVPGGMDTQIAPGVLLKKGTYKPLSFEQLEQVLDLLNELLDKQRAAERQRLEEELAAVQERLNELS